jgi:hypothetical protein
MDDWDVGMGCQSVVDDCDVGMGCRWWMTEMSVWDVVGG